MAGVKLLFGSLLIGTFLNCILHGVLVMQALTYFQTFKKDRAGIRYLVLYLFLAETLNTGFDIGMVYEPLIILYGTTRAVTTAPKMLSADAIMIVAISTPVQYFVAWRLKIISQSIWIPILIVLLATSSFVGGVAVTVCVTIIPQYARFHQFAGAAITWLASSAAADVLITVSLVWTLYHQKTGNNWSDDVINRIIRLTIQTGMITALFAIADMVFSAALPSTNTNFIVDLPLSKLYSISLLSTLNARSKWNVITSGQAQQENLLFGDQTEGDREMQITRRNRQNVPAIRMNNIGALEMIQQNTVGVASTKAVIGSFGPEPEEHEYSIGV